MRKTTRGFGIAVAAVLAVGGAGCGDDRADDQQVAVVEDLDLLAGAEEAGSARVRVEIDSEREPWGPGQGMDGRMTALGQRMTGSLDGVVEFGTGRYDLTVSMEVEIVSPEGAVDPAPAPMAMGWGDRSDGTTTWTRSIEPDGTAGRWTEQWSDEVDVEVDGEADEAIGDPTQEGTTGSVVADGLADPALLDPTAFLDLLRDEAGSVVEVGSDEVRGDAATRYRAELDPEEVDAEGVLWAPGDGVAGTVDVWIDHHDRLRRVEAGDLAMELWDFGVEVAIEVPDDVADPDDAGVVDDWLAQLTGEWTVLSQGTAADAAWTVYEAPAASRGVEVRCHTFELDGLQPEDPLAGLDPSAGLPAGFPMHGGAMASCGGAGVIDPTGATRDPAVVGLALDTWAFDTEEEAPALVAFVVSPRFRAGALSIVDGDGGVTEVPLDAAGVAVWDAGSSQAVTEVRLDGGAVSCPVVDFDAWGETDEAGAVGAGEEDEWDDDPAWLAEILAHSLGPCVRA